jgi:hypothetical protein
VVVLPSEGARVQLALAAIRDARTPALLLASERGLALRWTRALRQSFEAVHCLDEEPASMAAGPVTVATFATGYRSMWRLGDHFGLLLVDDVHDLGRSFPDEVLQMCTAPLRIGLTATPPAPPALRDRLAGLVGPVLFEVAPAERSGDYRPACERISWHLDLLRQERRRRALAVLLEHHGADRTVVFVGEEPWASSLVDPAAAGAGAQVRTLRSAPGLTAGRDLPAAEVAVIVGGGNQGGPARTVARLLRPPDGQRALVYELGMARAA